MGSTKMDKLQDEALTKAIEKAKLKAERIATQFGAEVGDVYSISETELDKGIYGNYALSEIYVTAEKKAMFEPGTIDIKASIYVVFKLKQKH